MAISPMMKHYLQVKEQYKDCILFYRLGDFYEMFFDDAVKVSNLLDLTLTGKDCGLSERAPMCGIPFHAAEIYIAKLVALNEKVAICEQLSEPNGKGLVERDVVKVVTAGTVTNNELIDDKTNNFLASVYYSDNSISVSWVDITTGEFFAKSFKGENLSEELFNELVKINPAEIICNKNALSFNESPLIIHGVLPKFNGVLESFFTFSNARQTLLNHFNVLTLEHFNIEDDKDVISSCGALISYLNDTQRHGLINIDRIRLLNDNSFMTLDINAIRNLELIKTIRDGKRYGSLLWVIDKTRTSMGARKLQSYLLSPLLDIGKINYRLNGVEDFYKNTLVRQSLYETLGDIKDIGRICGKISNGNLLPRDCLALKNSLALLPKIKFNLSGMQSEFVNDIINNLVDFSELINLLDRAIDDKPPTNMKDGGYIKPYFDDELDKCRNYYENGKQLIAQLEAKERERTGAKTLKIGYNRVFGYYIELTNSFKSLAPYDYERRQTLAGAERYITKELKDLEINILSSEEKALRLEAKIFNDIKDVLIKNINDLQKTSEALSELDVLISLSTVAKENNYVKPIMVDSEKPLNIVDGRHPVVETLSKNIFIPNDTFLDNAENRTMILTGPNMAGKSTYMRQTALIVLMAHIGSFVPCKYAEIPLVDKIFTRVGASDNLISDQSTFMVEMTEVADIILNATSKSLLILDEIGRGTSTYDGLSIAWAVVEYLNNTVKAKTMFATHYHELTELENRIEGIKNYKVVVKETEKGIVFLRKIVRGGANRSFGIEVAKLAGVSSSIIDRAKNILKQLENSDINYKPTNEKEETNTNNDKLNEIIEGIDINVISPIEALNILSELKEVYKKGK
ncbi:MAG: DNA mismatch repair protein MutS [Clostridia bacterium]|nr:DNA mismatch repair protein MutS [Clostridia bacterium]